jgi:hypothetical protein
MSDGADIDPELTAHERALAEDLHAGRPVPAPGFRGALGRHLLERDPGYRTRPDRLRLIVSGYLGAGAVLLALGVLQATGAL